LKKYYVLFFFIFTVNTTVFSQFKFADADLINQFLKTKTYIVLEDVLFSDFNTAIREVAEKHWKITPYEIIDVATFEKLSKKSELSFLIVSIGEVTGLASSFSFNLLNLIMGHPSGDINKMKEIIIVPLSYYSEDDEEENYAYKLGGILNAFQYYILNYPGENWKKWINENKKELKNKELWLTSSDLVPHLTIEQIEEIYPYKVKIVSEKDIKNAVDEKLTHIAFMHKVGNNIHPYAMKLIISCADGKLLSFHYHKITKNEPTGMSIKDFKLLIE